MLGTHKNIIISNFSTLVDQTNLNTLVPELLDRNVLNTPMVSRILNPSYPIKRQKTDLYIQILKRGPKAFQELINALSATNHSNLANILRIMADSQSPSVPLSSALSSDGSTCPTSTEFEIDGPCLSSPKEDTSIAQMNTSMKPSGNLLKSFPNNCCSESIESDKLVGSEDLQDSTPSSSNDANDKLFALPAYLKPLEEALRTADIGCSDVVVNYQMEKNLPVQVKVSTNWQPQHPGKPLSYKMDSNPRGCLLLINNINFHDPENYPERRGADNDETRVIQLFEQLHFEVERHRNKSKMEMENIIYKFSQNEKFQYVDCVCILLMSHGEEGDSKEDSEILGVDGIGLKTLDIVSYFDNEACKALINKPKLFFLQACRGCLTDPGVTLFSGNIPKKRIETDGRKVTIPVHVKIRSQSDIFIACPVPPGIKANRDSLTGAWFIQTIIEVFSAHAWDTHLEDLMKMVDQKIKRMNNMYNENFQSLTTKTIGWNKNLFFNPGLSRDQFGNTVLIGGGHDCTDSEEGMDVVDSLSSKNPTPKPGKTRHGSDYSRLKEETERKDFDRFKFWRCCSS